MAVCAVSDGNGVLTLSPSTPLDQCSYIVLDAMDYTAFIEVPISELYALNLVSSVIIVMALAVIAGLSLRWKR